MGVTMAAALELSVISWEYKEVGGQRGFRRLMG